MTLKPLLALLSSLAFKGCLTVHSTVKAIGNSHACKVEQVLGMQSLCGAPEEPRQQGQKFSTATLLCRQPVLTNKSPPVVNASGGGHTWDTRTGSSNAAARGTLPSIATLSCLPALTGCGHATPQAC